MLLNVAESGHSCSRRRRWRAPSPGSALGAPARHGRAALVSCRRSLGLIHTGRSWTAHLPRRSLSSSQASRLGRPPGVASRWLRQPRSGTHSQGFRRLRGRWGRAGDGVGLRSLVVAIGPCDTVAIAWGRGFRLLKAAKMGSKGLRSLVIQLEDWSRERIASQAKLQPAVKEIGKLSWQRSELVAVERHSPEVAELADLRGQRGELIAVEPQSPEVGELADLRRQRGEPVAAEPQSPEVGELADLRRQRGEPVVPEKQVQEAGELADLRGSAVSRLPSSHRSRRLGSWMTSGGSAVS